MRKGLEVTEACLLIPQDKAAGQKQGRTRLAGEARPGTGAGARGRLSLSARGRSSGRLEAQHSQTETRRRCPRAAGSVARRWDHTKHSTKRGVLEGSLEARVRRWPRLEGRQTSSDLWVAFPSAHP